MPTPQIALVGNFNPAVTAHQAIPLALQLAAAQLGHGVAAVWVATDVIGPDAAELADYDGVWCVPASPYANPAGALAAIRLARATGRPFLGTCGGFQHALIEFARNVLDRADADHAEDRPDAALPVIAPLACPLVEQTGTIHFTAGSRLRAIYGAPYAREGYHCRFGLNPQLEHLLDNSALKISGRDEAGEVRAVELDGHPFFFATLFQPERAALAGVAHPLVNAFAAAACADR
jgi:CTP synthase (UTP-ammonia lyase)